MNGKRAFEILNKIGFVRMGGTQEELDAANIILDEIKNAGGEGYIEEFDVNGQDIKVAKLEVLEPVYMHCFS